MPHTLSTFLTLLVDSVSYGMMLFLISVGLTITMGVMRIVNLTHSAFAMIGGFLTLWLATYGGLHYFVALPLGVAGTMLISLLLERTLYQWVYKGDALGQLLMTLGMTFVVTAIVKNIAGPQIQSIALPAVLTGQWAIGSVNISIYRLFVLGLSVVVAGGLWLCLEYTTFGARLRAAVDNPRMARCVGINVPLVFSITFAIGCGLAALGGAVGTQMLPLEPYYGLKYLVLVLIVVAVGGVGSLKGSLYSALLLGFIDTMGRYYIPALGGFIIYFAVLAILLLRPQGLVSRVG
ncbi:branched-chain amino acid ABC transporter permease [Eoetvoesiella caeni]|uniref:Branched-chain amino acid transport system permease protein n=1 Tax=Eoetvoesiella caeni TaxID=645616 RepID=A0A366HJE2_9BURK|nr:branched-chain amino acid ABC transporter permease [Eoetvoesiella caeni]MCI2808123.1 branched-chain amino acid ABC transporter permease [Eoetvoesiella caeni]NYT53875.1 branched-chain amino acid ABC transporter permease [Eoetvoesiella caeni]RBP42046.1 branched-chain amino acid transport system permease protein [Eoetvoesiella caeni]